MQKTTPSKATLYYDGECPVCSREIAIYQQQPGADSVRWVDAARCNASDLGADLTREAAMARLHLRRTDGSLVRGGAAFAALWQMLPRWSWLGRLCGAGAGLWLIEAIYRAFLRLRPIWRRGAGL